MKLEENDALLQAFVAGQLSEADTQAVLDQLERNDAALERVDALWAARQAQEPLWPAAALAAAQADGIERRLFRRLHRSNLSGSAVRLGTGGVGSVFLALIRPLAAWGRPSLTEEEKDD